MKKTIILAILSLVIATLSCNFLTVTSSEPTPSNEAGSQEQAELPTVAPLASNNSSPTQTPAPDVEFHGVSFSYDPSLAEHVNAEIIPAFEGDEVAFWMVLPEHIQFTYVEYVDN
jgi:hypothetical protein